MRRFGFWTLIGGVVFALLPVASLLISIGLASLGGCPLDEASAHPCVMLGGDWGGLLGDMAVAGWLALVTVPAGAPVALVGLVLYVVARLRGK